MCFCSFPPYLQGFHGDPRDYAWGADGIDNIITEVCLCHCDYIPFNVKFVNS